MTVDLPGFIYHAEIVTPDATRYDAQGANIVVLTQDNRICLQRRGDGPWSYPDYLSFWGGGIESGETFAEGAARELNEELSAAARPDLLIYLGAHERQGEASQDFTLGARFFWHDTEGSIGVCTEGKPELFRSAAIALADAKLHPGTHWALQECVRRGLIPA